MALKAKLHSVSEKKVMTFFLFRLMIQTEARVKIDVKLTIILAVIDSLSITEYELIVSETAKVLSCRSFALYMKWWNSISLMVTTSYLRGIRKTLVSLNYSHALDYRVNHIES